MTPTDEKRDLIKTVNAILKEISGIEAIYLFGSIAKGKENEKSDYDIAVIVREYPEKDMDKIARIRYSLLGKVKRCDGTPNRSRAAGHDCAVAL